MVDQLKVWVAKRARELRKEQTPQETELWRQLRAKRFAGFKFRRQEPIGPFIADFVCFRAKVVIELDGGQHNENQDHDQNRDAWLQSQGFRVLRFWNNQWSQDQQTVLDIIWFALQASSPLPNPSPIKGEGLEPDSDSVTNPNQQVVFPPLSLYGRGVGGEGNHE